MDGAQFGTIIATLAAVLGGPLAYLIQQARQDRKDTWRQVREVQAWAQNLVENHLGENTKALQQVAEVMRGCSARKGD